MMFDNIPAVLPQVKGKTINAIAVAGAKRASALPDVPTVAESGVPGFEASAWFGLVAPAKTPAPILAKLESDVDGHPENAGRAKTLRRTRRRAWHRFGRRLRKISRRRNDEVDEDHSRVAARRWTNDIQSTIDAAVRLNAKRSVAEPGVAVLWSHTRKTGCSSIARRGRTPSRRTEPAMYSCNRYSRHQCRRFAGKPGNSDHRSERRAGAASRIIPITGIVQANMRIGRSFGRGTEQCEAWRLPANDTR